VQQREGEHSRQARLNCGGGELRKSDVVCEVRDRDGFAGLVGSQARAVSDRALQPLETQGILVRSCDIAGRQLLVDQRDPCRSDR